MDFFYLFVKYWKEISKSEGTFSHIGLILEKVYRITTKFVRYIFHFMKFRLFTNSSFSQTTFTPY
jgi:hypothetical protein